MIDRNTNEDRPVREKRYRTQQNRNIPTQPIFQLEDDEETEAAIQELLKIDEPLTELFDAADGMDAELVVPTGDQPGAYCGPYGAGQVWVVTEASGILIVNGERREIEAAGAHLLIDHGVHSDAVLELSAEPSLTVHATCFSAGLAAPPA